MRLHPLECFAILLRFETVALFEIDNVTIEFRAGECINAVEIRKGYIGNHWITPNHFSALFVTYQKCLMSDHLSVEAVLRDRIRSQRTGATNIDFWRQ